MSATTPSNNRTLYGSIAMLIAFLLSQFNISADAAELERMLGQAVEAIQVLLGIGGFILALWNQPFRGKSGTPDEE